LPPQNLSAIASIKVLLFLTLIKFKVRFPDGGGGGWDERGRERRGAVVFMKSPFFVYAAII
jgi:hypothetical protein